LSWLRGCFGCVPEVDGVSKECWELDEDEPLELDSGGGCGTGGRACGRGCAAGTGGAGAAGAGLVLTQWLKPWNGSPVVLIFWYHVRFSC
jgi:hypothetical protein